MLNKFVLGCALCVTSIYANAAPSVNGNTISWPDDGWYQVQNQISLESVCEGGSSCVVATGDYIVINHSSGERFTDIRVGALNDDGNDTAVRVVDSVISWPDDGWYQVQRASDFGTECEGGRSCIVGPGFYNVINHTTGERFANIQVRTPSTTPSPISPPTNPSSGGPINSPVSVNGNIISWPDDGWYEVQNISDYSNVCSGQRQCQVSAGEYVVINHTTGVRNEPIRVVTTEQSPIENNSSDLVFDITVPAFMSNGLRVNVVWGDIDIDADFLIDESWLAIHNDGFPTNVELPLLITFSDDTSGLTLGTVERSYSTGTNAVETLSVTANQFNTERWDNDNDGVSNIAELIAGTNPRDPNIDASPNPISTESLLPVQASVELIADKTFRIRWQPTSAADFYRVLENPDGVSGFSPVSEELDAATAFYDHRVGLHQRVNARYMVEACNASGCTLSSQQLIEGNLAEAIGYLKASTLGRLDHFGSSLSISADGNTLAVSAPFEDSAATGVNGNQDDDSADGSGAVYIFTRSGVGWQQQAYLKASNAESRDFFGTGISLSADGNTLAVGAQGEDSNARGVNGDQENNASRSSGAVYLFARNGDNWQQQAYLKASNTEVVTNNSQDEFGTSVSLSADGNTLAVGARLEGSAASGINGDQNNNKNTSSGAVYMFVRSGGNWQQQAYIKSSRSQVTTFGRSVSLSADGNVLATTAQIADFPDVISSRRGTVTLFTRVNGQWQEDAIINDMQGTSIVQISGNGNTVAVVSGGSALVFDNIDGSWQEQASFDQYGRQSTLESETDGMSLSADGNTIAMGNSLERTGQIGLQGFQGIQPQVEDAGAVYVFTRGDGTWQQEVYVKASNPSTFDRFGFGVSLNANGDSLAVGASGEDGISTGFNGDQTQDGALGGAGAVYLY